VIREKGAGARVRNVIQRAFIHVAGPTGSGKTAFVEALLAADDGPTLVARCVRDANLRRSRESSPRTHPEMQRYRQAGAYATAMFAFPDHDPDPIQFYETQLMPNYSRAVILEGDNPAGYADLEVFVAPAPRTGQTLYVRRQLDVAAPRRARADAWEELLRRPDGMSTWMEEVMGLRVGDFVRKSPRLAEDVRSRMLAGIAQVRSGPLIVMVNDTISCSASTLERRCIIGQMPDFPKDQTSERTNVKRAGWTDVPQAVCKPDFQKRRGQLSRDSPHRVIRDRAYGSK